MFAIFTIFPFFWLQAKLPTKDPSKHRCLITIQSCHGSVASVATLAEDRSLNLEKRTELMEQVLMDAPRRLVREVLRKMDEAMVAWAGGKNVGKPMGKSWRLVEWHLNFWGSPVAFQSI
jgi:hypothetical protein